MKKLILLSAIAVFGLANINAQEESTIDGFAEGDVYISGSVGFSNSKVSDFTSKEFNFSPSLGFFISESIALELNLLAGFGEGYDENKTSSFGAGIGASYFFTPESQFSFTLGAGVTYINTKNEPSGGGEVKFNTFGIAIAPGLNYFVSHCFALRASIGVISYASSKPDVDDAVAENTFTLNLDLSDINFGVTYKFN